MGRAEAALAALDEADARFSGVAELDLAAAALLREAGRLPEAAMRAARAFASRPSDMPARLEHVRCLLAAGEPGRALAVLEAGLAENPRDRLLLAYRLSARRALDDPQRTDWVDHARDVGVHDLDAPAGWADIDAFNAELARTLGRLHARGGQPLDQTLRGGTQTLRPLQTSGEPCLRSFFQAVAGPVEAHLARMRTSPAPCAAAPGAWRVRSAWSIALEPDGFHTDHVHDADISSVYYVELPGNVGAGSRREGWLKFGQPPTPVPGADGAEFLVAPKPGRLVLFPSHFWHGTVPFRSQGRRLTIAFDVSV